MLPDDHRLRIQIVISLKKVAISVRNLIKNIDYAHLSPLFAFYRLNLGYSNREDFVIYFNSISIFLFGTKDMFPS